MRRPRNFYTILHVQRDAPAEIIRMSYRTLMHALKMHPDLGGCTTKAALINEAFATLRDPIKRAAYDKTLEHSASVAKPPAPAPANTGKHLCPFCGGLHPPQDASRPDSICFQCQSPLFPASKQPRTGSGRTFDRAPRVMRVHIILAGAARHKFDATTEDISIGGARVTCPVELSAGQHLKLDCGFCTAVGIVRHVKPGDGRPSRWHVGIEFVTLLVKQSRGAFVSTHA